MAIQERDLSSGTASSSDALYSQYHATSHLGFVGDFLEVLESK